MFRFEDPSYLYLLLLLPVLVGLFIYSQIRHAKDLKEFADAELLGQLMPHRSSFRVNFKFWLLFAVCALMPLLLARPQFGSKLEEVKKHGVEVVIAVDISNSMMANDIAPSRLSKAKRLISKLVEKLHDDKVGLIVFAGDAFTQLPITSDFVSAKMFLSGISPSLISKQGTAIGEAISLGLRSFTPQEGVGRTLILITDGENHEPGADAAAKSAAEQGVILNVLGIGSPEGGPIPLSEGSNDYMKDQEGNIVVTKLNEKMCQEIAQIGHGIYMRVDNSNAAQKRIIKEIDKMQKTDISTKNYSAYNEQFQYVAWIILLLLVFNLLILERKNPRFDHVHLFKKNSMRRSEGKKAYSHQKKSHSKKLSLFVFVMFLTTLNFYTISVSAQSNSQNGNFQKAKEVLGKKASNSIPHSDASVVPNRNSTSDGVAKNQNGNAQSAVTKGTAKPQKPLSITTSRKLRNTIRRANRLFKDSLFTDANISYRKSLEMNPDEPMSNYNLGNTLLHEKKGKEALASYEAAAKGCKDKSQLAKIYHNQGVMHMLTKKYDKAVQKFKESLRNNPSDDKTRYNLALAQKLLKDQQQKDNKDQKSKDKKNKDQNKDQKKNKKKDQKKDQDKKKDQKKKQNQNKDQKQKKQQQQAQGERPKVSKQNAEQMLKSAMQDEKRIQDKVKRIKAQSASRGKLKKQW